MHAFDPHLVEPTLEVLVARLAAVRAAMAVHVDQLFHTLTIAEEAVSTSSGARLPLTLPRAIMGAWGSASCTAWRPTASGVSGSSR